ncbi:MAG: sigma-54 dependent transcriptional regulator [Candidatus Desulfofervidaceae bacterium]|nr:sigma-54 dependent transcriptional regulator [Candidatus Desulfofervidaceae bacterium]
MVLAQTYAVKMQQICQMIIDLGPTDATVLIEGEEGTEKELVARAIHLNSSRRKRPFIAVNCDTYPQTLLESELWGHEEGVFFGAMEKKKGYFELVDQGTIFLNNIDKMPPLSQMKLLRILEMQEFERLGGNEAIKANMRIIAGTRRNLREEIEKGTFVEELYYRLNIITVKIPPLRERKEDIPLLVEYFLQNLSKGEKQKRFSEEAMESLSNYSWPGNVKELENAVQYAYLTSKNEVININDLPVGIVKEVQKESAKAASFEENERKFLLKILEENNWNKYRVAKKLNISRSTLYTKLRKYNLIHPTKN